MQLPKTVFLNLFRVKVERERKRERERVRERERERERRNSVLYIFWRGRASMVSFELEPRSYSLLSHQFPLTVIVPDIYLMLNKCFSVNLLNFLIV
jgi:hypothetical protein